MSDPAAPLKVWPEGITQARFSANDNSLAIEALVLRACLGVANDAAGGDDDGDVWIVGSTRAGAFATFNENDVAMFRMTDVGLGTGIWYAWEPFTGLKLTVNDVRKVFDGADWVDDPSITGGGGAVASVNGDTGAVIVLVPIGIACSDETTALTAGTAKATFRMPYAMTLLSGAAGVRASLTTAQATSGAGGLVTVDINESGVSILSTKLTIDNTEKTSTTAATPAVISDTSLADDAEITIDIDQIGDGTAKGLKVWLIGYPT